MRRSGTALIWSTRANDGTDVFAAQRGGKPAWHKSIHDLNAFEVTRGCHDFKQGAIERQRALPLREHGGRRFAYELGSLGVGAVRVFGVDAVHVLHDGEAGRSERVRKQKRARVSAVRRDA
jgi:hypothetical protein